MPWLVNLRKKTDYKYMISLLFYSRPHKLPKLVLRSFTYVNSQVKNGVFLICWMQEQTNNSEVIYFNLPRNPQRRKSWLAAISRDKSNLPSNGFVCSDYFEDKYFYKSWDLQNQLFYIVFSSYSNIFIKT